VVVEGSQRLAAFVAEALGLTIDSLDRESWDSLAQVELMMALEERYAIRLTTHEMMTLDDLSSIAEILHRRGITP
jgi:acyl carrier protein